MRLHAQDSGTPPSSGAARTGTADLPLHTGKAPRWLFERMRLLAREIALVVVDEFGPGEMLRRLSDPFWFQAFGCVLGFDWHSSGLTTTVCGALKDGLRGMERDVGLFVAGGKGNTSRQTPAEIEARGAALSVPPAGLVYASRMAAKVDSAAVQDGYQIYHHVFIFTPRGQWAVIQQGMNPANRYARRYHWLSEQVSDFVCEPHAAVCADQTGVTLNLVAQESGPSRSTIAEMAAQQKPEQLLADLKRIVHLELPARHHVDPTDIHPDRVKKTLLRVYERQAPDFEVLLGIEGVGAKTVRALALIAELVYGVPASFRDPARYSFAHGGKDGHPFPVDRPTYDRSISVLEGALRRARLGDRDRLAALRRLEAMTGTMG
ncbi:MAG: DUF763 domain-containing protein [Bacteroidetes bacterium]|nr:DUF763 domain-containing protein [Bacteroidota bacterium]